MRQTTSHRIPNSTRLRLCKRSIIPDSFRRRDFEHRDIQITFDDPKAYTKPWTVTLPFDLYPDTELIESICENEKDRAHMVDKLGSLPSPLRPCRRNHNAKIVINTAGS